MNDRYTQVSEKIESLVSSIDSRTRLAATDENLTLQERVQKLTAILTALTVILVILTIVLVGIELI
jgi:Mg2+ and Co2+ transporter CorA